MARTRVTAADPPHDYAICFKHSVQIKKVKFATVAAAPRELIQAKVIDRFQAKSFGAAWNQIADFCQLGANSTLFFDPTAQSEQTCNNDRSCS